MALFKELVRAIAEIEGLDEMTVTGIGQYARDGGFISKSGRGRAGAQMTARDAANLLIAVNATSKAKDAAIVIPIYRQLIGHDAIGFDGEIDATDSFERALIGGLLFGDAFELLLRAFTPSSNGHFEAAGSANVEISFYRPEPSVVIDVGNYSDPEDPEQYFHTIFGENALRAKHKDIPDRKDVTTISSRTLQAVGRVLAN